MFQGFFDYPTKTFWSMIGCSVTEDGNSKDILEINVTKVASVHSIIQCFIASFIILSIARAAFRLFAISVSYGHWCQVMMSVNAWDTDLKPYHTWEVQLVQVVTTLQFWVKNCGNCLRPCEINVTRYVSVQHIIQCFIASFIIFSMHVVCSRLFGVMYDHTFFKLVITGARYIMISVNAWDTTWSHISHEKYSWCRWWLQHSNSGVKNCGNCLWTMRT